MKPKVFQLHRKNDAKGVSGTGIVLHGVVFPNGKTVISWTKPDPHGQSSVGVFESFDSFLAIHVHSHPENGSEIIWIFEE